MGKPFQELTISAVVVGSGAAGFNAVHRLWQYGVKDTALVTENRYSGTSRNTGSDKQTYYKISLSGSQDDSVRKLAKVLYEGGCVDGDHALCEAALSAQGFFKLLELGVPFPHSRYGEFAGYKTDHDPNNRGTSAGPYTSRYMTEVLEQAVCQAQIPIYDHCQVIRILTDQKGIQGILCLNREKGGYMVIWCRTLIYATGGPAGIYSDSVYPSSQFGASGLAFEAGVRGKNLTEWQYGMASLHPRWNVSGRYMQVLPRIISTDQEGNDEREFLLEHYGSREEMMDMIFLKGYQWPFDAAKADGGSSVIDLLVYRERNVRKRRVWLDYRDNAECLPIQWEKLSEETVQYLKQAEACQNTPYKRLLALNQPAVEFYRERGVDLSSQRLEIAVCAQHNNGGLAVDAWWQTDVKGLFAVGEAAGTHGITRPGGSALNAGQVGSTRAAEYVGREYRRGQQTGLTESEAAEKGDAGQRETESSRREALKQIKERIRLGAVLYRKLTEEKNPWNFADSWKTAAESMSEYGAMFRTVESMAAMSREIQHELEAIKQEIRKESEETEQKNTENWMHRDELFQEHWTREKINAMSRIYRYYDMRLTQKVYLDAMIDYYHHGGRSRGSALYLEEHGEVAIPNLASFSLDGPGGRAHADVVQEILYDEETLTCRCFWRPVRKLEDIPEENSFEAIWKQYREETN